MRKWIAVAAALLFALQIAPARAEAHHAFALWKGMELAETMGKMAANESYVSLVSPMREMQELAQQIGAGAYGRPDAAVIIELPESMLDGLLLGIVLEAGSEAVPLLDEPVFVEEIKKKIPDTLPTLLMAQQGVEWLMLGNILTASGMDDLPVGLDCPAYALLLYEKEQVVCLAMFSPNARWQFASYHARFAPYVPQLETLDVKAVREMLSAALPSGRWLDLSELRITAYSGEEIAALLGE